MTFEMIKKNYDRGLWNKQMVKVAVVKNVITAEQYFEITGETYVA
ncbi:XkdX family protein [Desulfitobacterium sp. Sab5]